MKRISAAKRLGAMVGVGGILSLSLAALGQTEFAVVLRDGNQWIAKFDQTQLPWREIRPDGSVVERSAELASIEAVEFSQQSVSELAAEVRRLVEQLGSADYHLRNESEEQLLAQGGQFLDVIEHARQNPNPEMRYRVNRVLNRLKGKGVKQVSAEYDEIVWESASEPVRGDLGEWQPTIQVFGRPVALSRKSVLAIRKLHRDTPGDDSATPPVIGLSSNDPADQFYRPGDVHIDFDSGRRGESFLVSEDIGAAFAHRGVLFSAPGEAPGRVIAAGFRISQSRSAKNSAATMSMGERYKGTLRIDFCHPSLPQVPATVHRVGCYVAVAQDPGEIALRAFDRLGNLVGVSLANDKTSFLGVVSPEPIAWVTISSNRDLPIPPTEVDNDFAIDDLVFDLPRVDELRASGGRDTVTLRDGTRILGSALRLDGDSVGLGQTSLGDPELRWSWRDVRAIARGAYVPQPRVPELWGVCHDGSQVPLRVDGPDALQLLELPDSRLTRESLTAVFGGERELRWPSTGTVQPERAIVVLPFGYLGVRELRIEPDQVSWRAEASSYLPPSGLESLPEPEQATEYRLPIAPSIWFREPSSPQSTWGVVERVDRCRFWLGNEAEFQWIRPTAEALVIARKSAELTIPWPSIRAVRVPEPGR